MACAWFWAFSEKGVGQAGQAPVAHPHREVLPLGVAGRDVLRVGAPLTAARSQPAHSAGL